MCHEFICRVNVNLTKSYWFILFSVITIVVTTLVTRMNVHIVIEVVMVETSTMEVIYPNVVEVSKLHVVEVIHPSAVEVKFSVEEASSVAVISLRMGEVIRWSIAEVIRWSIAEATRWSIAEVTSLSITEEVSVVEEAVSAVVIVVVLMAGTETVLIETKDCMVMTRVGRWMRYLTEDVNRVIQMVVTRESIKEGLVGGEDDLYKIGKHILNVLNY